MAFVKCRKIHGMVYKELHLHESSADEQGKCSHKYVQLGAFSCFQIFCVIALLFRHFKNSHL